MTMMSLVAVAALRTGKIIKNGLSVFEKGEDLLRNSILHFVFRFSQSSKSCYVKILLEPTFLKGLGTLRVNSFSPA